MRAFEVRVNGKRLCLTGIGADGVMTAMVNHVVGRGRDDLHLRVGGLISATEEHVVWRYAPLKVGDEVVESC